MNINNINPRVKTFRVGIAVGCGLPSLLRIGLRAVYQIFNLIIT